MGEKTEKLRDRFYKAVAEAISQHDPDEACVEESMLRAEYSAQVARESRESQYPEERGMRYKC